MPGRVPETSEELPSAAVAGFGKPKFVDDGASSGLGPSEWCAALVVAVLQLHFSIQARSHGGGTSGGGTAVAF